MSAEQQQPTPTATPVTDSTNHHEVSEAFRAVGMGLLRLGSLVLIGALGFGVASVLLAEHEEADGSELR